MSRRSSATAPRAPAAARSRRGAALIFKIELIDVLPGPGTVQAG